MPQSANPDRNRTYYDDIFNAAMGNHNGGNYQAGSDFIQGNLGSRNFGGTNDYYSDLYGRLGNASFDQPINMLQDYLSGNPYAAGGGGGYGGGSYMSGGGGGASWTPQAQGQMPDSMANNSFYAQRMRELFDPSTLDPANNPTLQPVLDAIRRESLEGYDDSVARISAGMEGRGRYGGGMYQNMQTRANEEYNEALQGSIANVLMGNYEAERGRQMQGLEGISQRDQAMLHDLTQRYGIDAQTAAAMAGINAQSASASNAARMQAQGQARAQDLQAIMGIMNMNQFGLGQIAGIGNAWQGQQMGSLGAIPGLEGANQGYLNTALGAAGGLANIDLTRLTSNNSLAAARAPTQWAREQYYDPMNQMSMYINNILGGIGGMGWSGQGQGYNPMGMMNYMSPNQAAFNAGIGGYLGGGGGGTNSAPTRGTRQAH
jgi:hypothetical protein